MLILPASMVCLNPHGGLGQRSPRLGVCEKNQLCERSLPGAAR
jgi:hypothetical protein